MMDDRIDRRDAPIVKILRIPYIPSSNIDGKTSYVCECEREREIKLV